eukprot:TRINITY_DN69602_c0_g1_i1.p1 TRINITY_DN69602_c0_g1~~TRINITY_DN69602_c0_g1_i1.p1  ORF type:complete len:355 (+),score=78.37 TRINITY_DN69602_c0_g1_i1:62-1066(+)
MASKRIAAEISEGGDAWVEAKMKNSEKLEVLWSDPSYVSSAAWSCATLGYLNPQLFESIHSFAERRLDDLSPHCLADILWSFAALEEKLSKELLEKIQARALEVHDDFEPVALSRMVWALARLGKLDQPLMEKLSLQAQATLERFDSQHLADAAWGFAALGLSDKELFDQRLATQAEKISHQMTENHLMTLVLTTSKAGFPVKDLLRTGAKKFLGGKRRRKKGQIESEDAEKEESLRIKTDDRGLNALVWLFDVLPIEALGEDEQLEKFRKAINEEAQRREGFDREKLKSMFTAEGGCLEAPGSNLRGIVDLPEEAARKPAPSAPSPIPTFREQ